MLKTCGYCFKVHDNKKKCKKPRIYTEEKKDANYKRLIKSSLWNKTSLYIKQLDNYQCLICKDTNVNNYNEANTMLEVHHIIKVIEDSAKVYEHSNLITLCLIHHRQADKYIYSNDYLYHLIEKYRNKDIINNIIN